MVLPNFPAPQSEPAPVAPESGTAEVRTMLPYRPISPTFAIVPTVSVIIPARNEAANLPHVFRSLPPWVNEIIVVDGHSVDDTVAVAHELCPQARVITQPGRGKGDALIAGFVAATGDILVAMDADGSTDGAEIIQFVGALVCGADYAKGSRFSGSGGSSDITAGRRYGNWLLGSMVNRMFRHPVHRPLLRLQRLLGPPPGRARPRLPGLRDRDHDEHPGGQGRPAASTRCRASSARG